MNPLAEFYNKKVFKKLKSQSAQWTFSIVCSVVTVVVFVSVLMSMLIPQLFESITTFVGNIDSYAKALQSFLHTSIKNYEKFEHLVVSSGKYNQYNRKLYKGQLLKNNRHIDKRRKKRCDVDNRLYTFRLYAFRKTPPARRRKNSSWKLLSAKNIIIQS